jgi:hypothetical protein
VAGIRLRGRWVPWAALAAATAALLGLAVLNPDAYIAQHNVHRYVSTGTIDVYYLGTLSPDAVSALQSLPEPYRSCALRAIDAHLREQGPDTWPEWNLGRSLARQSLAAHPPTDVACPYN